MDKIIKSIVIGFAQINKNSFAVAEGGGYEVTGASVAEFELFL